ncbi:hypothetical protein Ddc_23727 [Ditylenchus destructor]|nr:hypothetical protein Ddc_23727 [Ditylenchus destructor]
MSRVGVTVLILFVLWINVLANNDVTDCLTKCVPKPASLLSESTRSDVNDFKKACSTKTMVDCMKECGDLSSVAPAFRNLSDNIDALCVRGKNEWEPFVDCLNKFGQCDKELKGFASVNEADLEGVCCRLDALGKCMGVMVGKLCGKSGSTLLQLAFDILLNWVEFSWQIEKKNVPPSCIAGPQIPGDCGGPTGAGPTGAGPTGAGPTGAGPTGAGPTGAGPTGAGPTGAGPQLVLVPNCDAGPTGAGPTAAGPTGAGPIWSHWSVPLVLVHWLSMVLSPGGSSSPNVMSPVTIFIIMAIFFITGVLY